MNFRALVLAFACVLARDVAAEESAPDTLRIAPSFDGHVGAWLLDGPFRAAKTEPLKTDPPGVDEHALTPAAGPAWKIASSGGGAIDVKAALKSDPLSRKTDLIAYAAGTLHVARAEKIIMLLGSDDGVRLSVDGKVVLLREEARPQRDDDDAVVLDLAAGDHPILFKLHQRDGAWSFRVRFVDARLAPPEGAWVSLPGAPGTEAAALATRMGHATVDLGTRGDAYVMHAHARFPEGAPMNAPLHLKAEAYVGASQTPIFSVDAGQTLTSARDFDVQLPAIAGPDLAAFEDKDVRVRVTVGDKSFERTFHPRKLVRETIARTDDVLARIARGTPPPWLREDTIESLQNARNRIAAAQNRGDGDATYLDETRDLAALVDALDHGRDPYASRKGAMRMAYRSPVDGALAEYGLYVPPSYYPGTRRKYPLIVGLHGLNGHGMSMMMWLFGGDEEKLTQDYEEVHWNDYMKTAPPLEAFVVTPSGHGNTMYRDLGEDDPMRVVDRVMARFPIDEDRVTITGPSMGGIGAAAIPFRHPGRFAAAEPLCGYHSYFVRRDITGRPMRPWERVLAEERSNVDWAINGFDLPLYIVHGTKDLPVANSGVLIDTYEKLHYSVEHEHPELGHNVWMQTYENLKGAKWLLAKRRDPHPRRVRFRTVRLRDDLSYWVRVDELTAPDVWGQVDARATSRTAIAATTSGIAELAFDRDAALFDASPITVTVDGQALAFAANDPLVMHLEDKTWEPGAAKHAGLWKHGEVTGPIRDAFHEPLLFVYGASDPEQARANEEVAHAWAAIRYGVSVHYPIISDAEFVARGENVANDRALFLVGNAKSNQVLRAIEGDLPIRIEDDAVVIGGQRITGDEVGAAFIRPNPKRPDRYVVVVEGTSALGTWRSLSLPDLLPDFVVWDKSVAPARGQMLLSAGALRAGGFFKNDWSLPDHFEDPLAASVRPGAKSEYDATPYLP
ncbi:MAG TPA: alpha/beta hydrolase-fold protein [Polyangiaceae bacterium]|jgi:poly(3-hydroxybutyrate) depolymerase